jgi:hypothetical protein
LEIFHPNSTETNDVSGDHSLPSSRVLALGRVEQNRAELTWANTARVEGHVRLVGDTHEGTQTTSTLLFHRRLLIIELADDDSPV